MSTVTNTAPPLTGSGAIEGRPTTKLNPVALEALVRVTGARPSSQGARDLFTEETKTMLVFADGAVILLAATVSIGQLLFLTNRQNKLEVVCQVVNKRTVGPAVCYVELQFTEERVNFWGVAFPKAGSKGSEFASAKAEQTTAADPATRVATPREEDVEQLKAQVELLRQQVQELERKKRTEGMAKQAAAAAGGGTTEALLMPPALPRVSEKKVPGWTVPMALPNQPESEKDPSEALLPEPELDFSQAPSSAQAPASGLAYRMKGLRPEQARKIALAVVLVVAMGVGAYLKAWTAVSLVKNAVVGRLHRERPTAPANASTVTTAVKVAGKSAPAASAAGTSAGPIAGNPGTNPSVNGGAAGSVLGSRDGANASPAKTKRDVAGNGPAVALKNRAAPTREKGSGRSRRGESASATEVKRAEMPAADAPVIPAKLLHAAAPMYPAHAMWNFITGDVKAEVVVDASGKVGEVKVLSGPKALRDAAVEALKKYEYAPATQGGKAIASKATATVKFWFNP